MNYFDPALYPLQMQRRRSQIDLSALKQRVDESMENISAGVPVRDDMALIQILVDKVSSYFNAKSEGLESDRKDLIFGGLAMPSEQEVGHLISLQCGHTARPSDVETMMLGMHLERVTAAPHSICRHFCSRRVVAPWDFQMSSYFF